MSNDAQVMVRQYGNIAEDKTAGLLGFSMASTVVLGIGAVGVFLFIMASRIGVAAAIAVAAFGAATVLGSKDRNGRSIPERWLAKHLFSRAEKKNRTTYRAGPASQLPDGSFRAPGVLAGTVPVAFTDLFGHEGVMLWHRQLKTGTVFVIANSSGLGLLDQERVDRMVGTWAAFQRDAGSNTELVQVSVTTQSTTDPRERLPDAVAVGRSQAGDRQVPGFARATMDAVVADLNQDVPKLQQWIALTFSARANAAEGVPERTAGELTTDVSSLLSGFLEQLEQAGAGSVSLMKETELIDQTYVAYNPLAAAAVERARLSGAGTGLRWEEVGPAAARVIGSPGRYEHGGVVSKSWQMWRPPAGTFRENALVALLAPTAEMLQKRVTVFYRPQSPDSSATQVQQALTNAQFAANQKNRRPTSSQIIALEKARKAEREQAEGASLVRFSIV
ncbi:SCO6880 family protein, partial [Kocuria dechangensis]|uniref:SCO6880 family protein n=1 Tax=Kocuria dechangensis TaxID=1176249 RepID=UPI00166B6A77